MTFAGVPNAFTNGTTADGPSVNQNNDAITTGLNNIDAGQVTTSILAIARGGTAGGTAAAARANLLGAPLFSSSSPSPGGTISNAAQAMFGATVIYTPATTGKMKLTVSGSLSIGAGPQTATLQLRSLGGAPPAYNDAAVGTILGATQILPQNGAQPQAFSLTGIITVTVGAAAWCDLSASISGGTTVSVTNLTYVVDEKPI